MRRPNLTRALSALALALALGACGGDEGSESVLPPAGPGSLTGAADAGTPSPSLRACADPAPSELPRPPSGELPCELLPPGFSR
jgi:hypothetical protein